MPAGAPTLYNPKYCDQLIEHMAEGYSFESFGGLIDVCRDTLFEWAKVYPEFSDAKNRAYELNRLFWEKIGISIAKNGEGNPTAWIFNMKNRFRKEWRDNQDLKLSGDKENPLYTKIVREIVKK